MAITGFKYRDGKGTYRKVVPAHLRSFLEGRSEFNKVVKVATKAEAERLLLPFIANVAEQLDAAARQYKPEQVADLTEEQAIELARKFHRDFQIDWLDGERSVGRVADEDLLTSRREEPDSDIVRLSAQMMANDYSSVSHSVDGLLQENGIDLVKGSASHRLLLEYVMRATIDFHRWEAKRLKGDFSQAGRDPLFADMVLDTRPRTSAPLNQVVVGQSVRQCITLEQLVEGYKNAPERQQLSNKTKVANQVAGRVFGEILGNNTQIADISRENCRLVQSLLMRLPPNYTKRFAGKSLRSVADHADAQSLERMSTKTMNSYMMKLAALFRWAVREQLIGLNPAEGLLLTDSRPQMDDRDPFNIEQLNEIFQLPVYSGCKSESSFTAKGSNIFRNSLFWTPLIALFTGMRANEIGSLNTANVFQKDGGVWVFEVTTMDTEDKKVKNAQSARLIPVHLELIKVGFLQYHDGIQKAGHTKLFPDLRLDASGYYSRRISDRFSRMLTRGGLKKSRQSFHSFRHNFRDAIKHALVNDKTSPEVARALGGWKPEGGSVADSVYGTGFSVEILAEKMALVGYKGLNLSHLKV